MNYLDPARMACPVTDTQTGRPSIGPGTSNARASLVSRRPTAIQSVNDSGGMLALTDGGYIFNSVTLAAQALKENCRNIVTY